MFHCVTGSVTMVPEDTEKPARRSPKRGSSSWSVFTHCITDYDVNCQYSNCNRIMTTWSKRNLKLIINTEVIFTDRGNGNVFNSICQSFCPVLGGWLPSMHHRSHDQEGFCIRGVCIWGSASGGSASGVSASRGVRQTPPIMTSSGNHSSGRYASYCNAFLYQYFLQMSNSCMEIRLWLKVYSHGGF